ncbi:MAG: hypothetical protein WBM53_01750 [Maribacter sp.]
MSNFLDSLEQREELFWFAILFLVPSSGKEGCPAKAGQGGLER